MAIRYTVIIPTLNAAEHIYKLIKTLQTQSCRPEEIIVVDSQSDDETVSIVRSFNHVRILSISREKFDHGGTRDFALRSSTTPFVVMMTQDALPANPDCMRALLSPFVDERVAAVCARQIARPDARLSEKAIRACRYPASSRKWDGEDLPKLGMSAFLLSDVCAAYRRTAYEAVGGFEHPIETNEDMLIAADLLHAGYRLAYSAEAQVWHSHNYTFRQEYERNRKIGRFLSSHEAHFDSEIGEGVQMVRTVSAQLLRSGRVIELLRFGCDCVARLLGNRMGRHEGRT